MAQIMIDNYNNQKRKYGNNIATQTSNDEIDDLYFNLSPTKHARIYYSKCYKSQVLSLNINRSKAFIITPDIWNILKSKNDQINSILNKKNDKREHRHKSNI
jgi:hypothetical protein